MATYSDVIVNIVSLSHNKTTSGDETIYTVPAGRYALIHIYKIFATSGGSNAYISAGGASIAGDREMISGFGSDGSAFKLSSGAGPIYNSLLVLNEGELIESSQISGQRTFLKATVLEYAKPT